MTASATPLKTTSLNSTHRKWAPRWSTSAAGTCRSSIPAFSRSTTPCGSAVGLFDVSHMGEIEIRGPEAAALTDYVTTNAVAKLKIGQAQYSGLLYEHGGFVDDILVHKVADDHYFLCVNASNQEKDYEHIAAAESLPAPESNSPATRYAQMAIQGPQGARDAAEADHHRSGADRAITTSSTAQVSGTPARIARTGYTGEDGFEIYIAPEQAERIWNEILDAGQEFGIKPCGLGARNTLRLEAKMALYGHEIHASITPFEAELAWIVKMDKGEFIGRAALAQTESGRRHAQAGGF